MTSEIVWLVGRYAFLGLLYLFVLLVLRALVAEMRSEPPAVWPARYAPVGRPQPEPSETGDLSRSAPPPEPEPSPVASEPLPPRVTVVASPDPAALPTGTTFNLTAVTTVGRGSHNSIALPSDRYASTNHALIFARGGAMYLRDRGSTNGTLLNDGRAEGEVLLHDGDRVAVGTTVLRYSAGRAPVEEQPPGADAD